MPAITLNAEPTSRPALTDWRRYLSLSDEQLSQCDLAVMNLAFAAGLPGAEQIDLPRCLRWLDAATDCVRRWTDAGLEEFFRPNPGKYNDSEAYFRVLGLATALKRHCGVLYDASKIGAGPEVPFEFHEMFVHGAVQGPGGTCATMPLVYAAIGRRLGYPICLVRTKRHMFARWDDPKTGERFNIECTNGEGFTDHPDDFYRGWPASVTPEEEQTYGLLRSSTPRGELAECIGRRAFFWGIHKRYRASAELFCLAAEHDPHTAMYPSCVRGTLVKWAAHLRSQAPLGFPRALDVRFPLSGRRWQAIPWVVEVELGVLAATEHCLADPQHRAWWWDPMRQGRPPLREVPTRIAVSFDQLPRPAL